MILYRTRMTFYQTWLLQYLLFLLCVAVLISGCGQQDTGRQAADNMTTTVKPKHPNYLRIPFNGVVTTIDPGLTFDEAHIEVVKQLFLGLTDFDPETYVAKPQLAKDWQVNEDGTVYAFHLRQDVKWTNGEPVTAHDIVWAIKRNLAPETKAPNASSLYIIKNAETINKGQPPAAASEATPDQSDKTVTAKPSATAATKPKPKPKPEVPLLGVRAVDDYTVEFTLEHAAGYFPALASLWVYRPLPRQVVEKYGDEWTLPRNIQTNGPYKLTDWKKASELFLSKNPTYYEADKVKIPEIHYYIVPESSLGLAMYEKGELDIMGGQVYLNLPQTEIPRIKSDPILRKELHVSPQFCTEWYGFNVQRAPMDKPLVRKAIAAAIDKQTLIDIVIKGGESPAPTFTRPPIFGAVAPEEGVGIPFNPKQARAWLAEAGYPDGKDFPKVELVYNTSEVRKDVANAVKTILKHYLNIVIEVRALDFDRYMASLVPPQSPQLFRAGWCTDYPDANNWLYERFHPKSGDNWIGWNNSEFAEVVEKAQRSVDPTERKRLYRRAEQILTEEEAAMVPLYYSNAQFLVRPWIKGWFNMAFGGQHIHAWALEN